MSMEQDLTLLGQEDNLNYSIKAERCERRMADKCISRSRAWLNWSSTKEKNQILCWPLSGSRSNQLGNIWSLNSGFRITQTFESYYVRTHACHFRILSEIQNYFVFIFYQINLMWVFVTCKSLLKVNKIVEYVFVWYYDI
jgi:hypothetical protein